VPWDLIIKQGTSVYRPVSKATQDGIPARHAGCVGCRRGGRLRPALRLSGGSAATWIKPRWWKGNRDPARVSGRAAAVHLATATPCKPTASPGTERTSDGRRVYSGAPQARRAVESTPWRTLSTSSVSAASRVRQPLDRALQISDLRHGKLGSQGLEWSHGQPTCYRLSGQYESSR